MKKLLTFILVLAMVLSVSSFALATETTVSTYEELVDAITSAPDDTTTNIKVGADISLTDIVKISGKDIVLDLNGKTIKSMYNILFDIRSGDKLAISDSSAEKNGLVTNKGATATKSGYGIISGVIRMVGGSAVFELNGGTIENTKSSGYAIEAGGSQVIINGGKVINDASSSGTTIYANHGAVVTVNGGEVINNANSGAAIHANGGNTNAPTVTINGGEVVNNAETFGAAVSATGSQGTAKVTISGGKVVNNVGNWKGAALEAGGKAKVTITGGEVVNESEDGYAIDTSSSAPVEISDGSVSSPTEESTLCTSSNSSVTGKYDISGGTFSADPSAYVPDNTLVAKVGNDTAGKDFIVGKGNIEDAANSQSNVTVEPISGEGNLDLDTTKGNQVVITDKMKDKVTINGQALEPVASDAPQQIPSSPQASAPIPDNKPSGSGISVTYNGGNSFSTSNPSVPTGVEIDGVPVTFNGTGSNFSVGCISSDAKWVTVRWNSTSVTTNFTPDGLVECTTVSIPKTGDMSFWAAVAAFFGF